MTQEQAQAWLDRLYNVYAEDETVSDEFIDEWLVTMFGIPEDHVMLLTDPSDYLVLVAVVNGEVPYWVLRAGDWHLAIPRSCVK